MHFFDTESGILAICSLNFVQGGKGRDQKVLFFAGWDIKKRQAGGDFFMSNPVNKCFLNESFLYKNKIWWIHNFFSSDCTFVKAGGLENSCLLY